MEAANSKRMEWHETEGEGEWSGGKKLREEGKEEREEDKGRE